MVRSRKKLTLNVAMNGILVGYLERLSAQGMRFQYAQSWLDLPGARPISLSLPLTSQTYDDDRAFYFFDNLLPDNPQIRARIQSRFQGISDQPFDLLKSIGKDCVGAIQLSEVQFEDVKNISAEPIDDKKIAALLKNYREAPLGMKGEDDDFRISIAGAQEKSAFLFYQNQWCRPTGTTPTTHIFKLPIGVIPHQQIDLSMSCENEWLCSQIANEFGIRTAPCSIENFEDVKVLVVERFDRALSADKKWIMRLPQEDICQALGKSGNLKYQSDGGPGIKDIMSLLLDSEKASDDRDNFFQAQILFWLLAAIDGHAKNFSLFIKAGGRYQLTPLYDIMSAYPLLANKQLQAKKIKMAMALYGKNTHYTWYNTYRRHLLGTAKQAHYDPKRAEELLDNMLSQLPNVIESVSKKLPSDFPLVVSGPIFAGMLKTSERFSLLTDNESLK